MKIVYCLNSIRGVGGMQRVTVVKANALAEIDRNEVYIAVTDNKCDVQIFPLSPKVHLVDLDINYYDGDQERSKIANIIVYSIQRRKHRKVLENFLWELNPDVVVAVGGAEKYMLLSMKNRNWKVIREFHFERNYRLKHAKTLFDKLVAYTIDFYDFHFKEKKYDRIIVLTQEDRQLNWKGWKNVEVISNPVPFVCDEPSTLTEKCVSYAGRLDQVKNCHSLVHVFKIVAERHPNWTLKLNGQGSEFASLKNQIDDLGLKDNVFLMGFTDDVMSAYCRSSISVLSSISEGFALVIVEAMECGVPVVSYQCPFGPKDLITEGVDGYLVPVGDEQMMAERICTLIEDDELRHRMGKAARIKAKNYHQENIVQQWMNLFNELVDS